MDDRDTIKAQRQQEAGRILARLNEILPPILAQYPVDAAYVYGSVARGTVTPFSDWDAGWRPLASLHTSGGGGVAVP